MRARTGYGAAIGSLLMIVLGGACEATNLGQTPPGERFFFPSGVLLDPINRDGVVDDELANPEPDLDAVVLPEPTDDVPGPRYLYVANGNNDRTFNTGTVVAIDLRDFWRSWYEPYPGNARQECLDRQPLAQAALDTARTNLAAIDGGLPEDEQALLRAEVYDTLRDAFAPVREVCDPRRGALDPFCHDVQTEQGTINRCVLPPGTDIDEGSDPTTGPCRRLPLLPHIVECDEQPFVRSMAHVGDFATTFAASIEQDDAGEDFTRLWLPVRGDPSITYIDVESSGDSLRLECEQGGDDLDPELCGDAHRLDTLRNDPDLDTLEREPFNAMIWERDTALNEPDGRGQRMAFVAHADGSQLSVIDLDGVRGGTDPAIVDLAPLYTVGAGATGGFGLAARPCFEQGQGPLGAADPLGNVPVVTQGCTRPLIYTSLRFAGQVISFTASGLDVGGVAERITPAAEREDCNIDGLRTECRIQSQGDDSSITCDRGFDRAKCCAGFSDIDGGLTAAEQCDMASADQIPCCEGEGLGLDGGDLGCAVDCADGGCGEGYGGPYCATPDQIGQPCAIECEPQVRGSRRIQPSLLLDTSLTFSPILGDMAFADPRGDQLLVVQTNPGALLSLDTSLGADGEPIDIPSAPPVELCAEPSRMKIYTERDAFGTPSQRFALITCFRAALVYVVDLEALRVVDAIVVGTGPHDLTIDEDREVAYVINNLEFSISVIDLSRRRSTRFQELARLGLQDPFSQ
ncbi:MAG: hypothetical protein AAF799_32110 [Myxococcota bacterium]